MKPELSVQPDEKFLADVSERDRPWDTHSWHSSLLVEMYRLTAGSLVGEFDHHMASNDWERNCQDTVLSALGAVA